MSCQWSSGYPIMRLNEKSNSGLASRFSEENTSHRLSHLKFDSTGVLTKDKAVWVYNSWYALDFRAFFNVKEILDIQRRQALYHHIARWYNAQVIFYMIHTMRTVNISNCTLHHNWAYRINILFIDIQSNSLILLFIIIGIKFIGV